MPQRRYPADAQSGQCNQSQEVKVTNGKKVVFFNDFTPKQVDDNVGSADESQFAGRAGAKTTYLNGQNNSDSGENAKPSRTVEVFESFSTKQAETAYYAPDGSPLAVEVRDYDMIVIKTKTKGGYCVKEDWYGIGNNSINELLKRIEKRFEGEVGGFVKIYKVQSQRHENVVRDLIEEAYEEHEGIVRNDSDDDTDDGVDGAKSQLIGFISLAKWRNKSANKCDCASPHLKYKLPANPYMRIGVARVESVADINNWFCYNKDCTRKFVKLGDTKFDQSEAEAKQVARKNKRFIKAKR